MAKKGLDLMFTRTVDGFKSGQLYVDENKKPTFYVCAVQPKSWHEMHVRWFGLFNDGFDWTWQDEDTISMRKLAEDIRLECVTNNVEAALKEYDEMAELANNFEEWIDLHILPPKLFPHVNLVDEFDANDESIEFKIYYDNGEKIKFDIERSRLLDVLYKIKNYVPPVKKSEEEGYRDPWAVGLYMDMTGCWH